ncbi:RagB/SusD family nutrient uptake outer membrane protein [Sphingobacterium yanglingense]|uniref:SusD-like starch-binding protein associating with outer membrane n=1 Tax=Sphingobacterium yanglingense TaxID=1437280 RepID=A0A4R6WIZ1_9SPHI|nr:RagB/SusD family nutrient uptake outer membrane protein [Sphingobacterium yanglingense]TDQ80124.1 SusD-like starch-binding protein associating with outer membrane [Sphingobacterium yanglingense]
MINKISTIGMICCLLVLQSCNKYLDIKPKGIQIPEFYDDYVKLLNHKSMMNADNPYTVFITDDILLGDKSVPFGQYEQAQENQRNLYDFSPGAVFSAGADDQLWQAAYKRIYTFNVVINNVLLCKDGTEKERQMLAAEAKVGRAFEYLMLVNTYARDYDKTTAATDLGVPLLLSEDINKVYVRNTVEEVYQHITKDLTEALPHLADKPKHAFKPSKQVGNAFMARMYLYMGDYEQAREFAEKALLQNNVLIDMTKYSINPAGNGTGRIYDASTSKPYPEPEDDVESIYARYGDAFVGLSRNVYASEDLLNTYKSQLPAGSTDQRRALFFADNTFKLYTQTYSFPGKSMWVPYIMFNAGFSTAELYLIAAEGYARKGDATNALKLLDKLRDKRILKNMPLVAGSAKEALKMVLEERRREFAFRGSMRLIDLKRLNREEDWKKDISHKVGTETKVLPANDKRYILPLPPKVIEVNQGIQQYDRG